MMPPPPSFFNLNDLASFIIFIASMLIFFLTKKLYRLTSHEGIRFFRYSFLFFGLSFLLRLSMPLMRALRIDSMRHVIMFLSVFLGTMAVLCLLYSVLWKRFKRPLRFPLAMLTLLSALIAVGSFLGRYRFEMLILQAFLYVGTFFLASGSMHVGKAVGLRVLYGLLVLGWLFNVFAGFVFRFSSLMANLLNVLSILLFIIILFKVRRSIRK